jgi:hypothetical protein
MPCSNPAAVPAVTVIVVAVLEIEVESDVCTLIDENLRVIGLPYLV